MVFYPNPSGLLIEFLQELENDKVWENGGVHIYLLRIYDVQSWFNVEYIWKVTQ